MDIFSEKNVIQKPWSAKNFSIPQTPRQVFATACRLFVVTHTEHKL